MNIQTQQNIRILPRRLLSSFPRYLSRLATLLISLRVNPNTISLLALLAGLGAGGLIFLGMPFWAGILIIICGLLDILDGKVAVGSNRKSLFGAIFDSTLDRYSEFFIYLGLAAHFRNHWALWVAIFALLGSTMVSYTRARAEGLGIECRIGIMQRAERMVFLSLGSIFGALFKVFNPVMIGVLLLIASFSNFTAIQRTFYVKKMERQKKS
ncbi:MAG: CDP-alcohol phosphatidyltransferase family protein [Candidatus Aminicenantales bacterium]